MSDVLEGYVARSRSGSTESKQGKARGGEQCALPPLLSTLTLIRG